MGDKSSQKMILWYFLVLFFISMFMVTRLFWPFVSLLVLAAVITSIFMPLFNLIKRKLKPTIASFVTCTVVFFVLLIPILILVGILAKEAYDLMDFVRGPMMREQVRKVVEGSRLLERINMLLSNFNIVITGEDFNRTVSEIGKFVGLFLIDQANYIMGNVLKFIVNFIFMLLVIFFLLMDGTRLISFLKDLSPLPEDQDEKLIIKFNDMAGAILIGNGLGGLIQGILGGAVFAIFGFSSSFLWGVIMGLLAFLPIVGIGIVFIPAAIYLFVKQQIASAVFFVVFYLILSGGIEYLFKPKVVGERVKMHTLVVFLSIMGGLKLFGILGIIYGPLVMTAFLTLTDIYKANYQQFIDPV